MLTVSVTNPIIQRLLLEHVIEQIESESGLDTLLQQGGSAEFLDLLRHRKARDLINVAENLKCIQFSVSTTEVMGQLSRLDRIRHDAELREYFINHGAAREMLCEFFKLSGDEVRRLRSLLLPDGGASAGRTRLPPPHARDEIHAAWSRILKTHANEHQRDRIYRLHQQFSTLRISTLHQTLKEFGEAILACEAASACTAAGTSAGHRRPFDLSAATTGLAHTYRA